MHVKSLTNFYQELSNTLKGKRLDLVMTSIFGSHKFGLDSRLSDYDFFVVYARPKMEYLSWNEAYKDGETLKFQGCDVQLMDLKRYFELTEKSNFTAYQTNFEPIFHNEYPVFGFNNSHYNYKKIAHHLLGLVSNKRQRNYMSCYYWLLLEWIYHFQSLPKTLHYIPLMNGLSDVLPSDNFDLMLEVFHKKKMGVKELDVNLPCNITHDDVKLLPDKNTENVEQMWLEYWENMKWR